MSLDESVFTWINNLGGHVDFIDYIFVGFANDYFTIIAMCLVLVGMWFYACNPKERSINQITVLRAMASLVLASGAVSLFTNVIFVNGGPFDGTWLYSVFHHPRPFDVFGLQVVHKFYYPHDSSFPSNLASIVFGLAMAVWVRNRKVGTSLLMMAVLACFARIYVGVHFPSDILGGIAFALFGLGLTSFLFWAFKPIVRWLQRLMRSVYIAD